MTEHGQPNPSDELRQHAARRPHLREHLMKFKHITGEFPLFIEEADDEYESDRPNVLYPVGGPIYCHIYGDVGQDMKYYVIEPELSDDEWTVFNRVRDRLLERSVNKPAPQDEAEYDDRIEELLEETVRIALVPDAYPVFGGRPGLSAVVWLLALVPVVALVYAYGEQERSSDDAKATRPYRLTRP